MAITTNVPNFTLPAPSLDSPDNFNERADSAFNDLENNIIPDINSWADEANATAAEINASVAGNYQGDWSATPTTYDINDVVTYSNKNYRNKTGTNTATTPDSDTTNWIIIPALPVGSTGDDGKTVVYDETNDQYILGSGLNLSDCIHVVDQKTSGTAGGSASAGDNVRVINTVLTNNISGASLGTAGASRVTLPDGTYYCEFSAPALGVDGHQIRLVNNAGNVLVALGSSEFSSSSTVVVDSRSMGSGFFTATGTQSYLLLHYFQTANAASNGQGFATNSGAGEQYAELKIWKVS